MTQFAYFSPLEPFSAKDTVREIPTDPNPICCFQVALNRSLELLNYSTGLDFVFLQESPYGFMLSHGFANI